MNAHSLSVAARESLHPRRAARAVMLLARLVGAAALLLAGLLALPPHPRALAAPPQPPPASLRPLEELLNPDGTLNLTTGFHGALDPTGWRMGYAADGMPIFVPAAPAGPANTWHALGSGLNNSVSAIAVAGPNVYVGGAFINAGGNPSADRIARWDGSTWHALGSGLNSGVGAIAVAGPNVYVGGEFTDAGGNPNADRIALWGPRYRAYLPVTLRAS